MRVCVEDRTSRSSSVLRVPSEFLSYLSKMLAAETPAPSETEEQSHDLSVERGIPGCRDARMLFQDVKITMLYDPDLGRVCSTP